MVAKFKMQKNLIFIGLVVSLICNWLVGTFVVKFLQDVYNTIVDTAYANGEELVDCEYDTE